MRNLMVAALLLAGAGAHANPKYYVTVGGVEQADNVKRGVVDLGDLKKWFIAELKSRPELTLDLPAGVDLEAGDSDVQRGFMRAGLKAFELSVRVLDVKQDQAPPKPGKTFATLTRGIRLSVFGQTIPGKVMAIGGDGAADLQVDIGRNDDLTKLNGELMTDATKQSLKQAVDMTITKLKLAGKPAPKAKKK
jgi:hypothetical protein